MAHIKRTRVGGTIVAKRTRPSVEVTTTTRSRARSDDEYVPERMDNETDEEAWDRIESKYRERATSPLKAIRAFCVLCMGCQPREVGHCTALDCVLYPFRFGRNPYGKHKKKDTEE